MASSPEEMLTAGCGSCGRTAGRDLWSAGTASGPAAASSAAWSDSIITANDCSCGIAARKLGRPQTALWRHGPLPGLLLSSRQPQLRYACRVRRPACSAASRICWSVRLTAFMVWSSKRVAAAAAWRIRLAKCRMRGLSVVLWHHRPLSHVEVQETAVAAGRS